MDSIVTLDQVNFTYPQNRNGLKSVSMEINPGDIFFIEGHSGSGKSTLARCIAGLIPHLIHGELGGHVYIKGKPSLDYELWEIAENVGMVFQNPSLQILASSVEEEILFGLENLGISRDSMKEILEETLKEFKLEEFRFRSPATLSGGEQQKLALAAIFSRKPGVLVLDEPLSMLDTTSSIELVNMLTSMNQKNISTVICEHRYQYLQHISALKTIHLNGVLTENPDFLLKEIRYPICVNAFHLSVNGLSVEKSGKQILKDINFSFQSGQIIAIVGRNGAGKTTLFRSIMGLQHYAGDVKIITTEGKKEDPGFNMIFQNPDTQLFNATVHEEILYKVSNPNLQLYEWLLDVLNLKKYEDSPPLLLSEGEKRRVALATALMRENRHGILLDEPSLGQDEYHKKILIHMLRALANAGYLVMFSTHDLELASRADQLVLLTPEGVISQGPVKEVIEDKNSWGKMGLKIPDWMDFDV